MSLNCRAESLSARQFRFLSDNSIIIFYWRAKPVAEEYAAGGGHAVGDGARGRVRVAVERAERADADEGVFKVRVVGAERLDGRRGASSVAEVICRTRVLRHGPGSRTRSARRLRCTATMIPDP
jgi:hypothetical protein